MENFKTEPQSPGHSESTPCALCSVDMAQVSAHLEHLLSAHFDIVSAAIHGMESARMNTLLLKPEFNDGTEPVSSDISTHQQFLPEKEVPVILNSSSIIDADTSNTIGNKRVIVIQPQMNMECESSQSSVKVLKTDPQDGDNLANQSSLPTVSRAETFRIDKLPSKIVSPYKAGSSTSSCASACSRQNTIIHPGAIHMPRKKGCVSKITMNPCRAKLSTPMRGKPIWGSKLRLAQLDLEKSSNKSPKTSDIIEKCLPPKLLLGKAREPQTGGATRECSINIRDSRQLPMKSDGISSSEGQPNNCQGTKEEQSSERKFQTEYVDVIRVSGEASVSYMSPCASSSGFNLTTGIEDLLRESQLFTKKINDGLFSPHMQSLDGFNHSIAVYELTVDSIQRRIHCMSTVKYQPAEHIKMDLDPHQEAQLGSSFLEFYVPVVLNPDDVIRKPTLICKAVAAVFLQPSSLTSQNLNGFNNLLKALLIHCLVKNRAILMSIIDRDHPRKYAENVFSRLLIVDPHILEARQVDILFVALSIVLQRDVYIYEISMAVQSPQQYNAREIHEAALGVCKQMIYTAPKALRQPHYEANCPCCLLHKQSSDEYFGLVRKTDEPVRFLFPWYTKPFIFK